MANLRFNALNAADQDKLDRLIFQFLQTGFIPVSDVTAVMDLGYQESKAAPGNVFARVFPTANTSAAIAAAVSSLSGAKGSVHLIKGAWAISSAVTVPATVQLILEQGALLTRSGSGALTINGGFSAPPEQVFSNFGNGTIVFGGPVSNIDPRWWGAKLDGDNGGLTDFAAMDAARTAAASIVRKPLALLHAPHEYTADVKAFGAIGDGNSILADTRALNLALAYLAALPDNDYNTHPSATTAKLKRLYFPAGVYDFWATTGTTSRFAWAGNHLEVIGDGMESTVLRMNQPNDAPFINFYNSASEAYSVHNGMRDLTVMGWSTNTQPLISARRQSHFEMKNVKLRCNDGKYGVSLRYMMASLLHKVDVERAWQAGIIFADELAETSTTTVLRECYLSNCGRLTVGGTDVPTGAGLIVQKGVGLIAKNCVFESSYNGIVIGDGDFQGGDLEINGCHFENCENAAVRVGANAQRVLLAPETYRNQSFITSRNNRFYTGPATFATAFDLAVAYLDSDGDQIVGPNVAFKINNGGLTRQVRIGSWPAMPAEGYVPFETMYTDTGATGHLPFSVDYGETVMQLENTAEIDDDPLTYADLVPDLGDGANVFIVDPLTHDTVIANPSGRWSYDGFVKNYAIPGQKIVFHLTQDGTGGHTIDWDTMFVTSWADTGNTANKRSTIAFRYDGTDWVQESYTPWW